MDSRNIQIGSGTSVPYWQRYAGVILLLPLSSERNLVYEPLSPDPASLILGPGLHLPSWTANRFHRLPPIQLFHI